MQLLVCSKSRALDTGQCCTNLNCESEGGKKRKEGKKEEKSEPTQTRWGFDSATAVAARVASVAATENFIAMEGVKHKMCPYT